MPSSRSCAFGTFSDGVFGSASTTRRSAGSRRRGSGPRTSPESRRPEAVHGGDDDGHDLVLAGLKIGRDADDGALDDRRVPQHRLLHLVGADVLAAAAQRVLVAVDEVVPAVGVGLSASPVWNHRLRHASTVFSGMP